MEIEKKKKQRRFHREIYEPRREELIRVNSREFFDSTNIY